MLRKIEFASTTYSNEIASELAFLEPYLVTVYHQFFLVSLIQFLTCEPFLTKWVILLSVRHNHLVLHVSLKKSKFYLKDYSCWARVEDVPPFHKHYTHSWYISKFFGIF